MALYYEKNKIVERKLRIFLLYSIHKTYKITEYSMLMVTIPSVSRYRYVALYPYYEYIRLLILWQSRNSRNVIFTHGVANTTLCIIAPSALHYRRITYASPNVPYAL